MSAAVLEQPVSVTAPPLVASTDQKALLSSLTILVAALPSRPPMQVLLGIKVTADADGVHLAAFDYEVSVTDIVPGSGSGEALVPGRLLVDMVKSLDPGPVQLEAQGSRLLLTQGDLTYTIVLLPMEDYPALPNTNAATPIATIAGTDLKHLNRVAFAAGRDDTLPVLTGVRLELSASGITAAATDRYRLAVANIAAACATEGEALVPAKTLAFITKHFGDKESVELLDGRTAAGVAEGRLVIRSGSLQITTRLLEGDFPKYRSLIPAQGAATATATVWAAELEKATKQVALVAARNAPVRLTLGETSSIAAGGADDAQATKKVTSTFEGDELAIAFNPAYLLDGVGAVTGKKGKVKVEMIGSTRPAIFTDVEDTTREFLYLLMPVRTSG